jgi:hypothetical protein
MLRRLWRSRRIDASGMFLRSAWGRPWFVPAAKLCWFVFAAPAVYGFACLLALAGALAGLPLWSLLAAPVLAWAVALGLLAWKKRSLGGALLSAVIWHLYALGALRGFLRTMPDPMRRIGARELSAGVRV